MRIFPFIVLLVLLGSCRKTKLKDEYSIFECKWKWVGATETRTVLSNGNEVYFYHDASDYPDDHFMEFKRKGILSYLKNDVEELNYRVLITRFNWNSNSSPSSYNFGLKFNNKKNLSIAGVISADSIRTSSLDTNLPLIDYSDNNFEYTYTHNFVKVN